MKGRWVLLQLVLTFIIFIPLGAAVHAGGGVGFWGMLLIMSLPNLFFMALRFFKRMPVA